MSSSEACAHYLEAYEAILIEHHRSIAAVIAESCIQGAAGFVMQPKGFLAGLAKLCKKYNVLLILDEIAVGMGRTGRMFAFEHEEIAAGGVIEPDFLCLGKGLTGGYLAMSATLSSRRIWEAFLGDYTESKTFFHGHTYGGNPLAAAAGLAVLDLLEGHLGDGRFSLEAIRANSERFAKVLEPLEDSPIIGQVRRLGMMAALVLVASKETKSPFQGYKRMGKRICEQAISRGLWLRPLGDVIPILPAVTTPTQELVWLGETLSSIFQGRDFTQSPQF
jgi:adenosylmethionine-8-amino-7-oxononanoate aminotransferase